MFFCYNIPLAMINKFDQFFLIQVILKKQFCLLIKNFFFINVSRIIIVMSLHNYVEAKDERLHPPPKFKVRQRAFITLRA